MTDQMVVDPADDEAMGLFPAADAWDRDPVRPDMDAVTPPAVVAELSPADRRLRVENLMVMAHDIFDLGVATHLGSRTVKAVAGLFSGGDDSTTLLHLMRPRLSCAIHCNTSIGIEQTRVFVRETCATWGLPLIEKRLRAGETFRDLVLGLARQRSNPDESAYDGGFPGPAMHGFFYQRLKERSLEAAKYDLGISGSRTEVAVYVAGRRRDESDRRRKGSVTKPPVPLHEGDGNVIWVSPIVMWTKLDMNTYRQMFDPPRNPVAALIHKSGECLCGAFAKPGELDELAEWFPEVAAEIHELMREARAAGFEDPVCTWGHGKGGPPKAATGRLCNSCDDLFSDSDADNPACRLPLARVAS